METKYEEVLVLLSQLLCEENKEKEIEILKRELSKLEHQISFK